MSYLESLFSLKGKTALVTGAARGNGRALADALLRAGARCWLVDILEAELNETVAALRSEGLDARARLCDVSAEGAIETLTASCMTGGEAVDILVNNAGITIGHEWLEYPESDWEKTYRINLKAPFELCQRIGKGMKDKGGGSVINVTSLNAEMAFPNNPAYVAFKGALKQLTKSMALDLGRFGIRANNIGPGYMRTNMTAKSWSDPELNRQRRDRTVLGRWGEPSDLAGAVIFLASDASSYVTGQDLYVDGGWLIKGL